MMIPHEYDSIRPYMPEELPGVFDELLSDDEFLSVVHSVMGSVSTDVLRAKLAQCTTSLDVQKVFFYPLIHDLASRCCAELGMNADSIADKTAGHTFVSNHRDIVLDSAFLSVLLLGQGFPTTAEIAIGDNLLIRPWIEKLVRVNKSFIVRRSLGMREMLQASHRLSGYMHFAIAEKNENVWIAQREGRAKDSNDRTQESVLKMMAMAGDGSPAERLAALRIVPLSISYEYDPCDYLKAREFQQKRDDINFRKSRQDDLQNMQTGIFGQKGRVHFQTGPCINEWLPEVAHLPKAEFFVEVARRMDRTIHAAYRLYPGNYAAADLLRGTQAFAGHYTEDEKTAFSQYVDSRVALVQLPHPDVPFLRERILTMYANPVFNQQAALA